MKEDEKFLVKIFENNGAILISVPKQVVDARSLKERIKKQEKKHKSGKCYADVILLMPDAGVSE